MGWCIKWGLGMLAAVMSLPAISLAAIEVRVDSKAGIQKISPYIFGKNISGLNDAETSDLAKIAAEDSTIKRMNEIGFRFFRANNGNNATRYNWRKKLTVHPDWYNNLYAHDWDITAKTIQDKLPGANAMYAFQLSGYAASSADYNFNDWDEYLKYGGFPILARKINFRRLSTNIVDMIEKVVNTDMVAIKNFTFENQTNSNRILRYLALQNAGNLSQNNLAKYLKTSQANVKNILDILEKTHLIFSIEAYGTSSKRMKKTKKYYFATSSIRNALSENSGNIINDIKQYDGILLENHVASILFNFTQ